MLQEEQQEPIQPSFTYKINSSEQALLALLEMAITRLETVEPSFFLRGRSLAEARSGKSTSVWSTGAVARSGDGWILKTVFDCIGGSLDWKGLARGQMERCPEVHRQEGTDWFYTCARNVATATAKRHAMLVLESANTWCKQALGRSLVALSDEGGRDILVDALRCILEARRPK